MDNAAKNNSDCQRVRHTTLRGMLAHLIRTGFDAEGLQKPGLIADNTYGIYHEKYGHVASFWHTGVPGRIDGVTFWSGPESCDVL